MKPLPKSIAPYVQAGDAVVGAAVLTETVYSWPGLGSEIANAITDRDLPVLLGLTLARRRRAKRG